MQTIVELMENYSLTQEDIDSILDLVKFQVNFIWFLFLIAFQRKHLNSVIFDFKTAFEELLTQYGLLLCIDRANLT